MVTYVRSGWVETGSLVGLSGACFLLSDLLGNHCQDFYYWNEHGRKTEEKKKIALIGTGKVMLGSQIMPQD